jgi:hypothetical protein
MIIICELIISRWPKIVSHVFQLTQKVVYKQLVCSKKGEVEKDEEEEEEKDLLIQEENVV